VTDEKPPAQPEPSRDPAPREDAKKPDPKNRFVWKGADIVVLPGKLGKSPKKR
jgi:hypothetical protein